MFRNDLAQTKLKGLMDRSFLDPAAAQKRMDRYGNRYGRPRLYDMLRDRFDNNKPVHSRRPGSLFSRDGYMPGAAGKRSDALVARRGLPDALKQADESKAALERARDATKAAEQRYAERGQQEGKGPITGKKADARDLYRNYAKKWPERAVTDRSNENAKLLESERDQGREP